MALKALETKWRKALSSILDELTEVEFRKLLFNLEKIPQGVKEGRLRGDMPSVIIQYYGTELSIPLIDRLMNNLPRMDNAVQQPLRVMKDELKKLLKKHKAATSKQQTDSGAATKKKKPAAEKKRRREKEPEEGASPAADQLERSQPVKKLKTHDSQDGKAPREKSIFDLKSRGILETEAIVGKVVKKSELLTSTIKTNYFFLGVADKTASVKLMVYGKDHHRQIKEGSSYIFRNLIKDGIYVKVTTLSKVSETKPVNVPEELEREAESLLCPESPLTSIRDIKSSRSQTHVSVKGTVTQIYPVKTVNVQHKEKMTNQQRFKLRQEDEEISVTMWDEATEQSKDLSVGDVLLLTKMRPNEYYGKVSLNSTKYTKITKVQSVGKNGSWTGAGHGEEAGVDSGRNTQRRMVSDWESYTERKFKIQPGGERLLLHEEEGEEEEEDEYEGEEDEEYEEDEYEGEEERPPYITHQPVSPSYNPYPYSWQ